MEKQPMVANHSSEEISQLEKSLILLNQIMRKHRQHVQDQFNISALEMELTHFVSTKGPQKMKEVSAHFDIKLSTLTSVIDKAERKKILKRTNSLTDRRVFYLDTSPKKTTPFQVSFRIQFRSPKLPYSMTRR
ncbi:MAG: MarR family winged helix-turn-helix transcriptional regulator, partial [Bacteroidota bacterium]